MAKDSIAVVDLDRCQPDRCNYECAAFCPPNRSGKECIVTRAEAYEDTDEDEYDGTPDQVRISEEICLGETCGICVVKCPFDAIEIINLPQALDEDPAHRYGDNAFALYGLPVPRPGRVTGLLGPNGIGKSTAVKLLAGDAVPNLGRWDDPPGWDAVLEAYRGTELQDYLHALENEDLRVARKPQYVDRIPDQYEGNTRSLLEHADERGVLGDLAERLQITRVLDQDIDTLSGGELQRVAIAAALARDAEFYFLDELTPYLDVQQRVTAARLVREIAEEAGRSILVVEHDLAILDLVCDTLHVAYGSPGVFGVITHPKSTRKGINEYLHGYLSTENMRIRPDPITFEKRAPRERAAGTALVEYPALEHQYGEDGFALSVEPGVIYQDEVIGVVGPNGIGKTTFAELLAGRLDADTGTLGSDLDIAYKPQYLEVDQPIRVDAYLASIGEDVRSSFWQSEIGDPLQINRVMEQMLTELSGGERQRVAIAACLARSADLYLLDEPSAHLDVEQRVRATRAIRRFAENEGVTVLVIDHDIYMMDLLADRLIVFEGEPAAVGTAGPPQDMRSGMNAFLENLGITFRRDEQTNRPRVNKPESQLDREQKRTGEYYYAA